MHRDKHIAKHIVSHTIVWCVVVCALLCVGCKQDTKSAIQAESHNIALIEEAEEIMAEHSAEALDIIRRVDANELHNEATKARYALIYSEICYYNRMLVSNDSLTRVATDYYRYSDNHAERARAFYQHGLVMELAKRIPEAIIAHNEVEHSLAHYNNPRLKGLSLRAKGDIYRAGKLHTNSYNSYKSARDCFIEADLEYHIYYTTYNMGQAALSIGDIEAALPLFITTRDYAIRTENKSLLCVVLHELCEVYMQQGDYARCGDIIDMFERYDCPAWFLSRYYAIKAVVEAHRGNYAAAWRNIDIARKESPVDYMGIENAHYLIYRHQGDYANALKWHDSVAMHKEEALTNALNKPILNAEIELLQRLLEQEERENRLIAQRNEAILKHSNSVKQRNIIIYIAIVVVMIPIIVILWIRARHRDHELHNYMESINELSRTTESSQSDYFAIFSERFGELNRLCETYYEHGNTSREASKILDEVKSTIETMKASEEATKLEAMVNKRHNNLMQHLRAECPKLNERELRFVVYSYAGFSTRSICIFLDCDLAALSRLKYKIKSKLNECGVANAENIISNISSR